MAEELIIARFATLAAQLRNAMTAEHAAMLDRVAAIDPCRSGCRGFENLGPRAVRALRQAAAIPDPGQRRDFSRALIATLAADTMKRADRLLLTPRIVERTCDWLLLLANFLETCDEADYAYPGDLFCKDYRFVTMLTVPCGAQVVDMNDGVGTKTALSLARTHPVAAVRAYLSPWFRVHTEGRYLDEFNDRGWQECYRELARLLTRNPAIRGMAATSWFYDPVLSEISPRLAYLRELPMAHGARLVRHGTTAFDIKSATATSAARRALFEAGKYRPVCCSILWERDDLIAWAEAGASHG